jgi:hypothetical protein
MILIILLMVMLVLLGLLLLLVVNNKLMNGTNCTTTRTVDGDMRTAAKIAFFQVTRTHGIMKYSRRWRRLKE